MFDFLAELFATGELVIKPNPADFRRRDIEQTLQQYESVWRTQTPAEPPRFIPDVSSRAAKILLIACRAVVFRKMETDEIERLINDCGLSGSDDSAIHYSVDLILRFLPQVAERAERISDSDALPDLLRSVARQWPLSSVGMKDCAPETVPPALQHSSLWTMYIDRIISGKDASRLNIPAVRDAVAAAIGPFRQLAPEISGRLQTLNAAEERNCAT